MLHSLLRPAVVLGIVLAAATPCLPGSVGEVHFPTSCAPQVQERFDRAVAHLHHMMYAHAEAAFREVAASDPQCVMAWWGVAMTRFHPLWAPPDDEDLRAGTEALGKARALHPATPRERAFLSAAGAYYRDAAGRSHPTRLLAWEAAQRAVFDAWPEDPDALAFYALARLATADKGDKGFRQQREVADLLDTLRLRHPRHPAGFHYLLHACDNPALAQRGLEAARGYADIAPDVPHALHMPSHIFVRLGLWNETAAWNARSAAAALALSPDLPSLHYLHALDYEVYAYLQLGRDEEAGPLVETIRRLPRVQDSFASAYALAASTARPSLERREWGQAARLLLPLAERFPWEKYPWFESVYWFARGLGAARSGDAGSAREAAARLAKQHSRSVEAGESYWAVLVDARRRTVEAWAALAEGDRDVAVAGMAEAAEVEESVDKHPVTPGEPLPARELLGDMLLEVGRASEALAAYRAALRRAPGRLNTLYGAGRACEALGDREGARAYYEKLLGGVASESRRPAVLHARAYVGGG
ncbi:MAG: hypothetical protein Kow0092_40240 [Deferrisomatales bacterium]